MNIYIYTSQNNILKLYLKQMHHLLCCVPGSARYLDTYLRAARCESSRNSKEDTFFVGKQVSNVHFIIGASFKQRQ